MGRIALAAVLGAAALAGAARAAQPVTSVLARAQGRGSVTFGVATARLHGRIWLYRLGGTGIASGRAETTCTSRGSGSVQWFRFTVGPGRRAEVWSYAGGPACMLTVTVRARGLVRLELRGY